MRYVGVGGIVVGVAEHKVEVDGIRDRVLVDKHVLAE